MKSLALNQIPGLGQAVAIARERQNRAREDAWTGRTFSVSGFNLRTMTVEDYYLLHTYGSPFINRIAPQPEELVWFLWAMSPQYARWKDSRLCRLQSFFFGRKVRTALRIKQLENDALKHYEFRKKNNLPEEKFELQDGSPLMKAMKQCFEYIDEIFSDAPAGLAQGNESCLSYLTFWFDTIRSEYHCSKDEVWKMELPQLFQCLKAIQRRKNPETPEFNKKTDSIKLFILRGLREKQFTMEDLQAGKVNFSLN